MGGAAALKSYKDAIAKARAPLTKNSDAAKAKKAAAKVKAKAKREKAKAKAAAKKGKVQALKEKAKAMAAAAKEKVKAMKAAKAAKAKAKAAARASKEKTSQRSPKRRARCGKACQLTRRRLMWSARVRPKRNTQPTLRKSRVQKHSKLTWTRRS